MGKPYRMKYAASHGGGCVIYLPEDPRKHQCEACKRKVGQGIKSTALHHTSYKYKGDTVKKNPKLALDNTIEVCFTHHKIADALRVLTDFNPNHILMTYKVISGEAKTKLDTVIKLLFNNSETFNNKQEHLFSKDKCD